MLHAARTLLLLLALALLAAAGHGLAAQSARDRTISLYNIHTKETLTVEYMKAGRRIPEAMDKIDWMFRDWRQNETTRMDPDLVDLVWEIHAELGSREPVHIISGYRSRGTNEMLRKSVGGQASESRHILGKAADIHFPDVPLKQLRYSALIRERGGVGYYPTSAIPFVHVDTDRVRHWPRLPRAELALLFPHGRTQHQAADGGPITREDVQVAQARHRDLATQIAAFFDLRRQPGAGGAAIAVADAGKVVAQRSPAADPARPELAVASLAPALPQLVATPRLVERPSRLSTTQPSPEERQRLSQLFTLAALEPPAPEPQLVAGPARAARPAKPRAEQQGLTEPGPTAAGSALADAGRFGWGERWARAPDFDEEHPDELFYRPFPLAPMLTDTPSADDPALAGLVHPDVARTVDLLDQAATVLPLAFRPGDQVAQVLWAQQFSHQTVAKQSVATSADRLAAAVPNRRVRTAGP